jgi:hypothetical protein
MRVVIFQFCPTFVHLNSSHHRCCRIVKLLVEQLDFKIHNSKLRIRDIPDEAGPTYLGLQVNLLSSTTTRELSRCISRNSKLSGVYLFSGTASSAFVFPDQQQEQLSVGLLSTFELDFRDMNSPGDGVEGVDAVYRLTSNKIQVSSVSCR